MDYIDVALVILAAGKGTRMKSEMAKVLHKVSGKSMVAHVVECAKKISRDNVIVVVGHQALTVKNEITKQFKVQFAVQEKLLGTGDAVKAAVPLLNKDIKDVLVLCGDVPLIRKNTLQALLSSHKENQSKISVLATDVNNPTGYGRIVLDNAGKLLCIREEADADENEKKIKKINTGIYCFEKKLLVTLINELKPDNNQAEYYLTDVVEIARKRNEKIAVVTMDDPLQVIGVNTLEDLENVESLIRKLDK